MGNPSLPLLLLDILATQISLDANICQSRPSIPANYRLILTQLEGSRNLRRRPGDACSVRHDHEQEWDRLE